MPDMDGFTVFSKLNQKPSVIFTTAYDTYALKAFEINAVDYLLKPFDKERLDVALQRIFEIKRQKKSSSLEQKIKRLIQTYEAEESSFLNKINLKDKGRDIAIFTENVIVFKSDGNYVQIITKDKTHLHRITMNVLYNSLDASKFLRIHRAYVLNKIYIKSCTYNGNNEFKFKMKNGEEFISSRSYKQQISDYLDE